MAYYAAPSQPIRSRHVPNPLSRLRAALRRRPAGQREALWLGLGLALAVLAGPPLVWAVGRLVLGSYANGGLLAFWGDFLRARAAGDLPAWLLLAGPYVLLVLLRLARLIAGRRRPAGG
jgi:hypothetical protein